MPDGPRLGDIGEPTRRVEIVPAEPVRAPAEPTKIPEPAER